MTGTSGSRFNPSTISFTILSSLVQVDVAAAKDAAVRAEGTECETAFSKVEHLIFDTCKTNKALKCFEKVQ